MPNSGKFIVFEGLDGCGKTTQLEFLRERLASMCRPARVRKVFITREPSDSVPGLICRGISKKTIFVNRETEALLFAADRCEHLQNEVLPQLGRGNHVLCDRYYFSNFAYQSPETPMDTLLQYNAAPMELLRADMTIFIDVPPEECERRRAAERATEEKWDNVERAKGIREQYMAAFERLRETETVLVVNGMGDPKDIFESCWVKLNRMLLSEEDYR
ncbi:MAG: dTMP kinase [Oscillospiraceae bacterium]|jgi:dTMP kinase|nr:dTMP kinase [Oscillospiraceae bacterium]